jgi:TonB-linked SusC/RagA family outer membrane protein
MKKNSGRAWYVMPAAIRKLLLMLKFTGLFLIAFLEVAASGYSQQRVSISMKNASMEKILHYLEKRSSYVFYYNNEDMEKLPPIDLSLKEVTVNALLDSLSRRLDIHYKVLEDNLVVIHREVGQVRAKKITGKVVNARGEPLPGISVQIKGTSQGIATGEDGTFSLEVPENATLVFSAIGFLKKEVEIGSQTSISVTLEEDVAGLNEVVVVGYGDQKKSDLTGSITSVKSKEIKNLPVRSVAEALQGRAAGVMISKDNGRPGSGSQIIIRGVGSINGLNPLFVIDGVPRGNNSDFNPKDVESIEIIKDASAAAIYGAQAAGGVVLITTKRGSFDQKTNYDFNATRGVRKITNSYKMLETPDYIRARRGMKQDYALWNNPDLPNTNWFDALYEDGLEQNYQLSISGGTSKSRYYISGSYEREDGIQKSNFWERFALRVNGDYKLGKRFTFGHQLYMAKISENPATRDFPWRTLPYMAVYNPDGTYARVPAEVEFSGGNDVASLAFSHRKEGELLLDGVLYLEWNIIDGLTLRTTGGGGFSGSFSDNFTEKNDLGRTVFPESYSKSSGYSESYTWTTLLTYSKVFAKKHDFRIMAGYEARKSFASGLNATATGFPVRVAESFSLSTNPNKSAGGALSYGRFLSQFGRINYSYDNKYLLTANIRRDGSPKFGPANRWGVFPSLAFGWKVQEEPFFKQMDQQIITQLKPRVSWGILGNDAAISNFAYLPSYQQVEQHSFDESTIVGGFNSIKVVNDNIRWEEIHTVNVGLDLNMFHDRLAISAEYYSRQTKDMLYNLPTPLSAGIANYYSNTSTMPVNIGKISNKGWELTVSYQDRRGDFTYSLSGNVSQNRNKVVDLGLPSAYIYSGSAMFMTGNSPFKTVNGQPIGQVYGLVAEGLIKTKEEIDGLNATATQKALEAGTIRPGQVAYYNHQLTGPGDLRYKDLNGDGKITDADRTFIGNPWPKLQYGFNIDLGYKGFDLTALIVGVTGRDVINGVRIFEQSFKQDYQSTYNIFNASYFLGNGLTDQPRLGVIDPSNPNKFIQDPSNNYAWYSSYYVEDGSYLKIKNISLGYTIPHKLTERYKIKNLRVYVTGQNLFTFTKFSGLDPEFSNDVKNHGLYGINTYPMTKLFSAGLDLNF